MKRNIKILEIVNDTIWIAVADGRKVYDVIRPLLESGDDVSLSFAGKDVVVTPFISAAIGDLYRGEGRIEGVESHLRFEDVDSDVESKINRVIANAKRPKKLVEAYEEILDREVHS